MEQATGLSKWLLGVCQREGLSLRQAGVKTGLSHATIRDVMNGSSASPETIKKLAKAFSGGDHHRLALEDELLVLAGYRSQEPQVSEPLAQLMDVVSDFSEPQLKLLRAFAIYLAEVGGKLR